MQQESFPRAPNQSLISHLQTYKLHVPSISQIQSAVVASEPFGAHRWWSKLQACLPGLKPSGSGSGKGSASEGSRTGTDQGARQCKGCTARLTSLCRGLLRHFLPPAAPLSLAAQGLGFRILVGPRSDGKHREPCAVRTYFLLSHRLPDLPVHVCMYVGRQAGRDRADNVRSAIRAALSGMKAACKLGAHLGGELQVCEKNA